MPSCRRSLIDVRTPLAPLPCPLPRVRVRGSELFMTQTPSANPAPASTDFGEERRAARTVRETAISFLVSLAFHAAVLGVMAMITWVVVRESEPEIVLQLGDGSGGAGSAG